VSKYHPISKDGVVANNLSQIRSVNLPPQNREERELTAANVLVHSTINQWEKNANAY
jgi:hypothetical protein